MPFLFKLTTLSHAALLGLLMMMTQLTTLSEAQVLSSKPLLTPKEGADLAAKLMAQASLSGSSAPRSSTDCTTVRSVLTSMKCRLSSTTCSLSGVIYDTNGAVVGMNVDNLGCTGGIPSTIANLRALQAIYGAQGSSLTGSLPSEIGNLPSLLMLFLANQKLSGLIPTSIGNMRGLVGLYLGNNSFTGAPDSLISSPVKYQELFPNPMTSIPYDILPPTPISNLTRAQFMSYLSIKPTLKSKRQVSGTNSGYTLQDLLNMCPLNQITSSDEDIRAGCLGGIKEFCSGKTDLTQCYNYYETTFTNSVYRGLIPHCPSWKKGNDSSECDTAVKAIPAGSTFRQAAEYFREVLFGGPGYTPCYPDRNKSCKWRKGVKVPLPGGALFEVV